MGKPKDAAALERYRQVLLNFGHVTDYVVWKRPTLQWIARYLPGISSRTLVTEMQKHLGGGGEVHQVVETREEYLEYKYHYDLHLTVSRRTIYVETVLDPEEEPDVERCAIIVVSIHDA